MESRIRSQKPKRPEGRVGQALKSVRPTLPRGSQRGVRTQTCYRKVHSGCFKHAAHLAAYERDDMVLEMER